MAHVRYQSCTRGHAMMNALNALLLCLTAAYAVPVHFPAEKTVIYDYYADVKAGIIEPAQYASQFALHGQLHIKKDTSDPTLNNAYYVKLHDLKYGMHNGMAVHHERLDVVHELEEAAQQIQDPFLIVYDEIGQFKGVKMEETESGWSRNIKQGIASMLQLDLSRVELQSPMKPHSFMTQENTIHGTCQVTYDIHSKVPEAHDTSNVFVITKMHDLKNCSHFVQRIFDIAEYEKCHVEPVDDMTTAARRVFHITYEDNEFLIKHLDAHSVINHFPFNAQSEAHYLLTNTTLSLNKMIPITETHLPVMNFQNVPLIRDITFNKPMGNYAQHAAEDLTHGRHIVKLDVLIPKLKKMLAEAADYLDENHMEAKEPDWKHGQTINRLQHTMSFMDLGSLEQVYNTIHDPKTPKEVTMKSIFLRMVPIVGTTAACHFTRNAALGMYDVDMGTIFSMLFKLPMHVKVPSERLLLEMENLLKGGNTVSPQVKRASILCFSILIRKTFMHQQGEVAKHTLLVRYLQHFMDHVKNDQAYVMKLTYLMAIKNVQVGNIENYLEPIITGEVSLSENPHHIRVQAIWAIKNAVADKVEYTHDLLWPILSDVSQPLPIRIMAYDVLMSQLPNMQRLMNIYWLMVYEKNEHLYNYHFTTLKGLANSVDPCMTSTRDMARKVMRYTRIRPVDIQLSSKHFIDYTDPKYEFGESLNTAWVLDELTGMPHAGYFEHRMMTDRKSIDNMGIYWSAYGLNDIMKIVKKELFGTTTENLTNKNVQTLLNRAAYDMPAMKNMHVDFVITLHGCVASVQHFDHHTIKKMPEELHKMNLKHLLARNFQDNIRISYGTMQEMQVPTDMGLQAVIGVKVPNTLRIKFNDVRMDVVKPSVNMKFESDTRLWQHSEQVMSIYNPIVDVWHSIRRATSQDVALPLEMNIGYNHEAKSLKITVPRLPMTKLSHVGMRRHTKNLVTITEDEQDLLKSTCATCHHYEVVSTGQKRTHHAFVDSKDVGLKYSRTIFDCENNVTPMTEHLEWERILSPEHMNTWNSMFVHSMMAIRHKQILHLISPRMGTCGILLKHEPSILYPSSRVDLNIRANIENVHNQEQMHMLSGNKINVRGTFDVKAASTNESVRTWDMNMNMDMSQGHVVNNVKIQITRMTPGEKNLKICIDAQKSYPETKDISYPNTGNSKLDSQVETNTKMTIAAGFTADDKCVRDEMLITMTVKGEMSDMQKNQMRHDSMHSACAKDMKDPHFQVKKNHFPKTMNCVRESIMYSTMRKYTVNMSYKKVPVSVSSTLAMFDDIFRLKYLPYTKYITERTENGNMKSVIEFPADMDHVNITLVTPNSGYEYVEIPMNHHELPFNGMMMDKPKPHFGWHIAMDNIYYSASSINKLSQGQSKICTVYPQVLITLDNSVMPLTVSDSWTLVSGDHIDQTYAVFVKTVQDNMLAVKFYIAGHVMEIMPSNDNNLVSVDGNVVNQHEKGVMIPLDEPKSYAFKLTQNNDHLVAQSQRVPVMMMWTPNSVSIIVDTTLQGRVTGICGHMDNTHKEKIPKIYNMAQL